MDSKGAPDNLKMECSDYRGLLETFGPDYTNIKKKLGFIKGLVKDDLWKASDLNSLSATPYLNLRQY